MAFLCPVRMRRDKKKATNANIERDFGRDVMIGRITGSSSIETLVRVGIEKEHGLSPDSKMIILHDFTPCVDDELEVKRGQLVNVLYRENDWAYVIGHDSRQEGFIPYSYCVPYTNNGQLSDLSVKKKLPREQILEQNENSPLLGVESADEAQNVNVPSSGGGGGGGVSSTIKPQIQQTTNHLILQPECTPFHKNESGRYIVLYTFIARDENDISVERGEFVTVLNREDPDWFWIIRSDGQEGFIPSTFGYPADTVLQTHQKILSGYIQQQQQQQEQQQQQSANGNANNNLMGNSLASNKHQQQSHHNNANTNHNNSTEQIPRNIVRNLNQRLTQTPAIEALSNCLPAATTTTAQPTATEQVHQNQEDLRFYGTELVMLYDYKAQAPDDLSVRRGEWIYADLNNQTVEGWLWGYAPKTRKCGFIPKAYARQQPQTQL